jgi:hypothetical protein
MSMSESARDKLARSRTVHGWAFRDLTPGQVHAIRVFLAGGPVPEGHESTYRLCRTQLGLSPAAYKPMGNDRRDFNPMGEEWGYILDETPPTPWRELVAVRARRATWPFEVITDNRVHRSYGSVRLSPDWCFYAWGTEYVGAGWYPVAPHIVRCHLMIGRRYDNGVGWPPVEMWSGVAVLDLRDGSHAWEPYPSQREREVLPDVRAEIGHKAGKLLAFFQDAIGHWKAGDQERPVQATDLYHLHNQGKDA